MHLNAYLTFNGNCEEAFHFYEERLGGKILEMFTYEGSPMPNTPPDLLKKVMHGRMQIGESVLMASDAPPGRYEAPEGTKLSLHVDDPAEAEKLFQALSEGGQVVMPIAETFWALRFAMFNDRFGIPWMINCPKAES